MIGVSISDTQLRQTAIAELSIDSSLLSGREKNPVPIDEAGGTAESVDSQLSPEDLMSPKKCVDERLDHDPGVGGDDASVAKGSENPPSLRMDVVCVEPGQDGSGDNFDVTDLESGERDENHDLYTQLLRHEEIDEVNEWGEQQKKQSPEETAGLHCDEHVVRECTPRDEKRAVQIRSNRLG